MTVEEAEKLFIIIDAMIDYKLARYSSDGGLTESLRVSSLKEEFLDLIVENQK